MRYSRNDIINALLEAGLEKDDTVFFSTSLGMVGIPPPNIKSQDALNELFLDAIREVLSEGNIIVPTYSYTFGKSTASNLAIFDVKETKAEIGPFPEFVRKQKDAIRSLDPFVSVTCIGKNCKELLDGISNISYGENSFFERLVNCPKSKCCSIGLGPNWTPFIHYADYLMKVPHRYDKLFWGYIQTENEKFLTPWIYSVRFNGDESYPYAHIAGREAEKEGIWKYAPLGRARVYVASCKEYFDFVIKKLQNNPFYLAKGPACDVIEKEKRRVKYKDIELNGFDEVFEMQTGEWLGNFLIPERWGYSEAILSENENKSINITPMIHSLSIEKELSTEELLAHSDKKIKNFFFNRDWGFVYEKELPSNRRYKISIKSEFGKGIVKIAKKGNKYYAYLEQLEDITHLVNGKSLKRTIYLQNNKDWKVE